MKENERILKELIEELQFTEGNVSLKKENDFFKDISKVRIFTGDEDCVSSILQNIFIKEREIFATDGISGIIVENDNIPNEFKNTIISPKFTSMKNVGSCILKGDYETEINKSYDMLTNAFSTLKNFKYDKIFVHVNIFFKELMHRIDNSTGEKLSILECNGNKLALNSSYLNIAVSIFDKDYIDVFFPDFALHPIILKNEKQKVLVLPVRVEGFEKM